jgi:uncharacterized protein (DUF1697 family)
MADLRALFEGLGFRDVRTVRNSGNVVFSAANERRGGLLARIEEALASTLGLTTPVTILSANEVAATVLDNPLSQVAANPSHLLVVVPRVRSDLRRLQPLLKERWAPEALALGSRVAYVWCANGIPRSPLWNAVDRALGRSGTARNMVTVTKVMALVAERPS